MGFNESQGIVTEEDIIQKYRDKLKTEIKEHKEEVSKADKQRLLVESEISSLEGRIKSLKAEVDLAYKSRLEEIDATLKTARDKENEAETTRGDLLRDRDEFENIKDQQLAALESQKEGIDKRISEIKERDEKLGELEKSLNEKAETLKKNEADYVERVSDQAKACQVFSEKREDLDAQRQRFAQALKSFDDQNAQLEQTKSEIAVVKKALQAEIQRLDQAKSEHEAVLTAFYQKAKEFELEKESFVTEKTAVKLLAAGVKTQEENIQNKEHDIAAAFQLLEKRKKELEQRIKVYEELSGGK